MSTRNQQLQDSAASVLEQAKAQGADAAEVIILAEQELTAKVRLGKPELVQQAASRALGLRVKREGRVGLTYSSDLAPAALTELVTQAVSIAALAEPDEAAAPPDPAELASDLPTLDLYDEAVAALDADAALARATEAEQAGLDYDDRITNSEGGDCSVGLGERLLATSGGFCASYRSSYVSLSVEPVADDADGKKRNGSWWDGRRHLAELQAPADIGEEAARRTVAQLGARKIETGKVPVIFSPEAAGQVLSTLFSVVSGAAAYQKSTYLLGCEGEAIAAPAVTVLDDPLLPGAPGSRPFDGDGLPSRQNVVVDQGRFTGFLCDTYAANRLGLKSTGSAGRGASGATGVSPSNFYLQPGPDSAEALLADTPRGLYISRLMGFGFNPVTGDFSKGAEGFWIDGGARAYPVSEITVSASFEDLLKGIDRIANDLNRRSGIASPTFRVAEMMVAGS